MLREMQINLIHITLIVLVMMMSVVGGQASHNLIRRSTLSFPAQNNVNQRLRQKHQLNKLKLTQTHSKRDSARRPRRHSDQNPSTDVTTATKATVVYVRAKRPRLHFKKYDLMNTKNATSDDHNHTQDMWKAVSHNRTWTAATLQWPHQWVEVLPSEVEHLYAPIEVGQGYSSSITYETTDNSNIPFEKLEVKTQSPAQNESQDEAHSAGYSNTTTIASIASPTASTPMTASANTTTTKLNMRIEKPNGQNWRIQNSHTNLRDFPQCQLGYFKDNGFVSQHRQYRPKCTVRTTNYVLTLKNCI